MKFAVYRYKNDADNRAHVVLSAAEAEEVRRRLGLLPPDRLRAWVTISGLLAIKKAPRRRGSKFLPGHGEEQYLEFSENSCSLQGLTETGRLHEVEYEYGGRDGDVLFVLPPLGVSDARPIKGRVNAPHDRSGDALHAS